MKASRLVPKRPERKSKRERGSLKRVWEKEPRNPPVSLKTLPCAHPYPNLSSVIVLRLQATLFSGSFDYENTAIFSCYVLTVSYKMFRLAPSSSSSHFSSIIAGVKVFQGRIVTEVALLNPWLCVYIEYPFIGMQIQRGRKGCCEPTLWWL